MELLGDLVDRVDRAVERERDPRDVGILGRADRERVDIEAAAAEEAGDPGEDARAVLDQQREDVLAPGELAADLEVLEANECPGCPAASLTQPTMSLAAAPAGIIG